MRIVIDLQGAQSDSRFRGIGRYSLSLARAIAKNAGEHEVWIALNAQMPESIADVRAAFSGLIPDNQIRIFEVPTNETPSPWVARCSEIIRESFLATLQPDVVLLTSLFEGYRSTAVTSIGAIPAQYKTATVLYDLIPLTNKEVYLPTAEQQDIYYRKIESLKNADVLLAISNSSRQEAVQHLEINPEKITNISAAIGDQFYSRKLAPHDRQEILTRLGIKNEYILYAPGGFDPRKNFERLLEAYGTLPSDIKAQYQLVIASKLHPQHRLELLILAKRSGVRTTELVLTGYVEDEDLVALYSLAKLFVFPSTHEGFGLPVLEAMACGTPVIGSDCSSVPEVIGLADALFDPLSVPAIAAKMKQALEDEAFRVQLIENAVERAKSFSWDESARKALVALEAMDVQPPTLDQGISIQSLYQQLLALPGPLPTDRELHRTAQSIVYNFSAQDEKQLFLDVSCIVHSDAKSGIQRVVRSLLHEFITVPPKGFSVRPIYYANDRFYYANKFNSLIDPTWTEATDTPIDYRQDDIYLSLDLNMHLTEELNPLLVKMKAMGVHINHVVYDLLLVQRPDWWPAPNPEMFVNWLNKITQVASRLICISGAVASELQEWIDQHPPKRVEAGPLIESFHLGADINNSMPSAGLPDGATELLLRFAAQPSFLMVSTIEPRKGHAQTLEAFEALWSEGLDINLVIVGKRGWLMNDFITKMEKHPERNRRLFWLEGVSDEYLEKVYSSSACLIAASEGEGFGLPLIEAAQHHLPMIIRDLPVFREVAGEHAFYFHGLSADELGQAIKAWLALFDAGEHPTSMAMPWLTWEESAQQLKTVLFGSV